MKIKINKLLTLCMVLFVLFTSAIPTMAQGEKAQTEGPTGTITYHTGKQDVNGVEFKVYRIMDATTATEQGGSNDLVAYTFNTDFKAFLESEILKDGQLTGETSELKAQEYLNKNVTKPEFQSSLKNEITTKQIVPVLTFPGVTGTTSYTCNNLPYGYYVIIPSNDTVSLSFATLYSPTLDVYSKGLKPGVDKTIDDNKDKDSAQIGDEVNFTVKSTVPNMTGFDKYTFKLVDTLSEGLTFVNRTISVQVGDKTLADGDIIVTKPDASNGNVLTIEIKDFIKYKDQANKEIIFKYSAILNEKAIIDGSGNTNTANVQYGNNPDKLEESSKDVVTVYTHTLTINKKDDGTEAKPLAGAEFQIFKKTPEGQKGEIVKFIKDPDPKNEGTYRVATKAEIDANTATVEDTVVSPTSGIIVINGLDAASYLIYETKAPDGYNKLKQPIEVTITTKTTSDGQNVTVEGNTVDVVNKRGTLLPETGGMGTLMFTIVGVVGILAVAYSFKPKKSKSE